MDIYSQERKIILKDLIVEVILLLLLTIVYIPIRKYLVSINDGAIKYILYFLTFLYTIGLLQKVLSISVYSFMYKKPKYFYTDLYKVIDVYTIKEEFFSFLLSGFISSFVTYFILVLIGSLVNKNFTMYFGGIWSVVLIGVVVSRILTFVRFLKKVKEDAEYADGYKNGFNFNEQTNYFNQQYYSQQQSANQQYDYSNQYNTEQNNYSSNKKEYNRNREPALPSYYKVLGFNKKPESFDDIKLSYRRLVKVHHPDRGGDMETMQKINDAYESAKRERNK